MSDPKLKEAMAEIKAICRKHDIAGYISLVSTTHSEFGLEVTPSWSCAYWEDKNATLRFRAKQKELGKDRAKQLIELTCHMIYQIRDLCALGFKFADNMTTKSKSQEFKDECDTAYEKYDEEYCTDQAHGFKAGVLWAIRESSVVKNMVEALKECDQQFMTGYREKVNIAHAALADLKEIRKEI